MVTNCLVSRLNGHDGEPGARQRRRSDVLIRQGSAVNLDPADGSYTTYTANAVFGSGTQIVPGNYVVYRGSGSSVAVTGLTLGTAYYVAVYVYKGTLDNSGANQETNYKPAPATGSQSTSAPTAPPLSSPTATAIGGSTATLGANLTSNGGAGGWGYTSGQYGSNGEEGDGYAFGSSGGGGSSAIKVGATLLAEATGGNGGRSSDWNIYSAGEGGAGGGTDYPATTLADGGGAGGAVSELSLIHR